MAADLILPIVIIVMMYVIIGCIDDALTLFAMAILFIPIAFMFAQIVGSGGYTELFGAPLVNGMVATTFLSGAMFLVPIFSILKIFYLKHKAGVLNG